MRTRLRHAARLYAALLALLCHVPGALAERYANFSPKDTPALWLHLDRKGGGAHAA